MSDQPYNPLDKKHLGESVAEALLLQPIAPLPPQDAFVGAGVYAIYYTGDFEIYEPIARRNRKGKYAWPIYVGKAVPRGARKGGFGLDQPAGRDIFNRLAEHAESISQSSNLKLGDFACRYLVVDDIWIPLGESLLIERLSPLWNKSLDGFGIHDPGGGRAMQKRSQWDVVHPGRPWTKKLEQNKKTATQLLEQVRSFLKETEPLLGHSN